MQPASEDPVDLILSSHGLLGPWSALRATGIANRIYATQDVVLRIATDSDEAVCDARTESVAAPVAYAAGILTPRLIAFDDSRRLLDRPYSIWERVHGDTFGLTPPEAVVREQVWFEVGRELARLHLRVTSCPDPKGFLDDAHREAGVSGLLREAAARLPAEEVRETERLMAELAGPAFGNPAVCFLHNDMHAMNVMCGGGRLLALIDWGDAGWGDPTVEFAAIPLESVPPVIEGYRSENAAALGPAPEAGIVWDKLFQDLERVAEEEQGSIPWHEYRAFLDRHC